MKKVLSLVLTLSLVLGTFSMAFAASFSDVEGESYEDAVSVLTELGVVSGYDDGTYKPENIVTRAEMAVFVVRALGYNDVTSGTSTFTDMDGYGWAQPYIAMAEGLGVISGYGDGTFRPGNTVSYDEAATMLVASLGYTAEALNGTWPANFVDRARVLGILDGVSTGSAGTNRGDIATMVYQTLDQQIGKVNKDGDFVTTLAQSGTSDTMLERLGAKSVNNGDAFVVDQSDVEDAAINIRAYLGAYVTAYANDDDEIIAISEVKSTFLTGEYDDADGTFTADDVEYTINDYGYTDDNNDPQDALSFQNGSEQAGTFEEADFVDGDEYTIAANVSGKRVKEIYSVSVWTVTEDAQVDADDIEGIESDQELLGVDFPLDDNDEIDLNAFELVGVSSLDEIAEDNVVYVYENDDEEIAKVAVGTEVVTGEITKVNSDGDTATINGVAYELSSVAKDNLGDTYFDGKAGDTYTLYLDAYGDVYDMEKGAGEPDNYAVVLGVDSSTSFGSTTFEIKLFLADGTTATFDVDDEVALVSAGAWDASVTAGALVSYDLNNSSEIDELTVETGTTVEDKAISSKGYFNGREINSDAVIFSYEGGDKDDDANYSVASYNSVLDSDTIDSVTYVLDNSKIVAMLLEGFSSGEDVYGVFTGYSAVSGDYDYEVTVLIDGTETTYSSDTNYSTLVAKNQGVYKLRFDGSGALRSDIASYAVADGAVADTTYAAITTTSESAISRSGNTLTVGDVTYTLDSGYSIYEWSEDDGCYVKGNIRDIVGVEDITVMLFDVYDDDLAYDIVLWYAD